MTTDRAQGNDASEHAPDDGPEVDQQDPHHPEDDRAHPEDDHASPQDGTGGHQGDDGHEHPPDDHEHHHHDVESVGAAVLTVSTSRSLDDDPAGDAIASAFEGSGHQVVTRELVRDDYDSIQDTVHRLVERDDTDVVVSTGGTGITPDDVTVEAVRPLIDKQLPGFGELFRRLSQDEIGTRVVGTRATAGVVDCAVVFCLPGSENAARLGAEEIIVPESPHLAGLARRVEVEDPETGSG